MNRILVIAALLTALGTPLAAQDFGRPDFGASRDDQRQARDGVRAGRQAPLSRVLATIARGNPGRHLNTTQGDYQGRTAYFVQWQYPDGQVVIFVVDAESGQTIARQGG